MIHNYQNVFCYDELKYYISQSLLQQGWGGGDSHLTKF